MSIASDRLAFSRLLRHDPSQPKSVTLGLLLALGLSTVAVAAFQAAGTQGPAQGAGAQDTQVEKLKDNLVLLRGGGGNTAVLIAADGVTVVDTKIPGWGQPLIATIKAITPTPVVRVINTHTHYDHVGGNADTLAKAATLKDADSIITGHSTVMTPADLMEYSNFNRSFLEYVRAAKKAGRSVEVAASAVKFPEKFANYRAPQPDSVKNNIEVIYAELK